MTNINLPALEKRFQLSSKDLGLIAASNDISAILLVSFVSFYGEFGNKIKWLGYGMLITGQFHLRMRCLKRGNVNDQRMTLQGFPLLWILRPHVPGYFWIRNFCFPASEISPPRRSVFKSNSPVHAHLMVSGFILEKLGLYVVRQIGLLFSKRRTRFCLAIGFENIRIHPSTR